MKFSEKDDPLMSFFSSQTKLSEKDERLMSFFSSLPPLDEASPVVRNDSLLQSLVRVKNLAEDYELKDLYNNLDEVLRTFGGKSRDHVACQQMAYSSILDYQEQTAWNDVTARKKYTGYVNMLLAAFLAPPSLSSKAICQLLGPKGRLDMLHQMQSMKEKVVEIASEKQDPAKLQRDFEQSNPIHTNLCSKEAGYKATLAKAKNCTDATEADNLAKKAFYGGKVWAAKLWWEKAIELDATDAKRFSNLAMLYTKIGRYLRSIGIGYRGLATQYMERAVSTAKKGISIDGSWERSYQRGAEALFALGHYEHAIDALKLLKQAFDSESPLHPSDELKALQHKAKKNATAWLSLRVIPDRTSVPQIINASIENLRKVIIENFYVCCNGKSKMISREIFEKAGDDIADALQLTLGALQLIYTRRIDWEIQSRQEKQLKSDFQVELCEAAKLVPLQTLVHSETLRRMTFAEDPVFSFWGLDRLDRLNTDFLRFDAKDPCENEEGDPFIDELMQRGTGSGLNISSINSVCETVKGKRATSSDRDMSSHHLCAFTMNLLERIILSEKYPTLRREALGRVIDFFNSYSMAVLMGGDSLGYITQAASGYLLYSAKNDTSKFFEFIELEGGLTTIAREICSGGDMTGNFQQLLCKLSPQDWRNRSSRDIYSVFYEYGLLCLDQKYVCLEENQNEILKYVKIILSSILTSLFSVGDFDELLLVLLGKSSFGQYLIRGIMDWSDQENYDPNANDLNSILSVVSMRVDRWVKLSSRKRSAYRWAAMSPEEREKLARLKPISKIEKFEKKLKGSESKEDAKFSKMTAVTELPECALCGVVMDLQKCPCKLVYYCGKECQNKHWKKHKTIHKRAMLTKK